MSKLFQAIRGMNDILPDSILTWQFLEHELNLLASGYGYHEIRFPILEETKLFKRTIGDVTDIVEKEMYTFSDRNGDSLSLRPEGTAGCVRAAIEHSLLYNQTQKLWYMGPMYRHERPQKGRYRQFHQFGLEAFGFHGVEIEVELIMLTARLWARLGLSDKVKLEINTLGQLEERSAYRQALVAYLSQHKEQLDSDSLRRLETNPLRILDSKNEATQAILKDAPVLLDYLGEDSLKDFEALKANLAAVGIAYNYNPRLVRGLDYYNNTVFEWTTDSLGAQGTVCAGGRYDSLVPLLGGKPTPAVGFALGMERLVIMLEHADVVRESDLDFYAVLSGQVAWVQYMQLAERLRDSFPDIKMETSHQIEVSFKNQFKKANKSGARFALVLGEDELAKQMLTIKHLREDKPQETLLIDDLCSFVQQNRNKP